MRNFKNFELTKDQQAIVTGQGAPAYATRPDGADKPAFVDTILNADKKLLKDNLPEFGAPNFAGDPRG